MQIQKAILNTVTNVPVVSIREGITRGCRWHLDLCVRSFPFVSTGQQLLIVCVAGTVALGEKYRTISLLRNTGI